MNDHPTHSPGIKPYTVVLTGGIASGKTTVSDLFDALGVPVIDTDRVAHQIVEPGSPALLKIINTFGREILLNNGALDREKLRNLIFKSPKAKRDLENILHPAIHSQVLDELAQVTSPYCVLVIPLFAESKNYDWIDWVLLIDTPEHIQIERLMKRDSIDANQARAILDSQASRAERQALANDTILNVEGKAALIPRVQELHRKYLNAAAHRG